MGNRRNPDWVVEAGAWVLENGHRTLLALTGGRWPHRLGPMPTLELHTIGRKSGERRSSMLSAPIFEPDRIVVVASLGGASHNPAWYLNLVANPEVEVTVRGDTKPYLAHPASAEEKAALWPTITKVNPGYAGYQRNTDRDIPVVVLTPA